MTLQSVIELIIAHYGDTVQADMAIAVARSAIAHNIDLSQSRFIGNKVFDRYMVESDFVAIFSIFDMVHACES